jgi:hypothetical protein
MGQVIEFTGLFFIIQSDRHRADNFEWKALTAINMGRKVLASESFQNVVAPIDQNSMQETCSPFLSMEAVHEIA